jgi:ADP-heptose:LPS heptosyltransferase
MKEIVFGIPSSVSVGDFLTLNPTMTQNKNSTLQFVPCKRSLELADLYLGVCKIQFVEENEIVYQQKATEIYGDKSLSNPFEHACINFLNIFKYNTDNFLPKIKFYDFDFQFAQSFLSSRFKKPICINMVCGNYKDKLDYDTQYRMMAFEKWQAIINILNKKGYDILHFGKKDTIIEGINGVKYVNDLSIRQTAACFNHIKTLITLDSGPHHLALASMAKVYCLHPSDRPGYLSQNYHYDNRFWKKEERRVFYDNFEKNFNNLIPFLDNI